MPTVKGYSLRPSHGRRGTPDGGKWRTSSRASRVAHSSRSSDRTFKFDDMVEVHRYLENGGHSEKNCRDVFKQRAPVGTPWVSPGNTPARDSGGEAHAPGYKSRSWWWRAVDARLSSVSPRYAAIVAARRRGALLSGGFQRPSRSNNPGVVAEARLPGEYGWPARREAASQRSMRPPCGYTARG